MNLYKRLKHSVEIDDLKPNMIYWFGCDTQQLHYYGYFANSWFELYYLLLEDNLFIIDNTQENLSSDFDYKKYILEQQGNAYYQAYTETDERGNRIKTEGDINWFIFLDEKG